MWILIGVTAALLVCDRVLKALARSEKLRYRGKLLQLTHLENPGFFLGKGSRYPRLLRFMVWSLFLKRMNWNMKKSVSCVVRCMHPARAVPLSMILRLRWHK